MAPIQMINPFGSPLQRPSIMRPMLPAAYHHRQAAAGMGRRLGQLTTGREKAAFYGAGLINLLLMGATAWVGITVGREKTGALSAAGWVTGIGAILAGLYGLGVMGVETAKPAAQTTLVPAQQ